MYVNIINRIVVYQTCVVNVQVHRITYYVLVCALVYVSM